MGKLSTAAQEEAYAARKALYDQGLSDKEIGDVIGRTPSAICLWRRANGLPATHYGGKSSDERMDYYRAGHSDPEIARRVGVSRASIVSWRAYHHLPPQGPPVDRTNWGRHMTKEERAARHLLYQLGYSDGAIARQQARSVSTIEGWRGLLGLRANGRRGQTTSKVRRRDPHLEILRRIKRAVGRGLPDDIAADTCSDLMLAVMTGEIPLDEIEASARRYGNRTLDAYANRWRSRSADELVAGTEDLHLIDTFHDERSSNWLEEMGATVC
jgi:transposase